MLSRDTLQANDEVLKGAVLSSPLRRLAVHEVIESSRALHEVVSTTENAEDTEGENPDTDDGDDGGLTTNEPTPDGEAGSDDIDDQDSTGQLPRRDGRPEGTVGTGDEDKPVLSEGDLEEEDLIHETEVLDDTAVGATSVHGGESDPGTDSENDTEDDGHTPELRQVPLDRVLGEGSVIVSDSQGSDISENGNEDDQLQVKRAVEDSDPETQEDFHVERQGDTVDDVSVHTMENLAGSLEGIDDSRETGSKENDIGSGTSSVRGTLDGNTSIGLLQGWGIVDTVTSHSNQVTTLLQDLDDIVLVLGEDLSETISSLDEIVDLRTGHGTATTETETLSVVDVSTETELAGSFTSNTDGVTSQHLDGQTESLGLRDSLEGIVTWGVRAGHDTEDLPGTLTTLASNTERTETTGSELSDLVLVSGVDLLGDGVVLLDSLENEERGTLDASDALALGRDDDSSDLLGDGVEGMEVNDVVLGKNRLGARVVLEGLEESLIDSINTLLLAGSSQASSKHEILGLDTGDGVGLSERELVLSQGTGLVRAENLDTSEGLDGRELLDDSLLSGEVSSTDGHGGGDDSGETDGDTDDGDGQGELKDGDDVIGAVEGRNPSDQESDNDKNQEDSTDVVQDLSEVTSTARGSVDQSGSATDEGVVTGRSNDHESLTTLDSGGSVASIALVLVDGERLTSQSGLIDLEESTLSDDATIGRDNGTLMEE